MNNNKYKNIFDSHAHILKQTYKNDYELIVKKIHDYNIKILSVGFDYETTLEGVALSKRFTDWKSAVGIHPTEVGKCDTTIFNKLEKLYLENKENIVAIGETGIDNKYPKDKEKQIIFFNLHIQLSKKYNLPVIIHCREAFDEVYEILKNHPDATFLFHSWSNGVNEMKKVINMKNVWFSYSGMVTYSKNRDSIQKTLEIVPKDRILIETDSPWLTPEPNRNLRNDPTFIINTGEFIAKYLNYENYQDFFDLTYKNTLKLFSLKK